MREKGEDQGLREKREDTTSIYSREMQLLLRNQYNSKYKSEQQNRGVHGDSNVNSEEQHRPFITMIVRATKGPYRDSRRILLIIHTSKQTTRRLSTTCIQISIIKLVSLFYVEIKSLGDRLLLVIDIDKKSV